MNDMDVEELVDTNGYEWKFPFPNKSLTWK